MIRVTQENVKIGSKQVYAFPYHSGETVVLFKRRVKERDYFLDFAICCARGKLDVETDGDY
jgi:hypothetical protein